MTKLPANVIQFAGNDPSLFEMFVDYWDQYRSENGTKKYSFANTDANGKPISFAEKEIALNAALKREISKRAGVDFSAMPLEQAITHPMVCWAANNIVSQLIEAIMPNTIIDSIGAYAEVRTVGYGETALFDINSRDLFPVSRSGRMGMRQAEIKKAYQGQVALNPEQRTMTVGVSMWRLLTGQESLANFAAKSMRSLETAMTKDVYDAMAVAMAALSTTATTGLRVVGYTQDDLVKLSQKVSAFSGGAKPIVLGTKVAVNKILPDNDSNYRYQLDSEFVKVGYLRTVSGIDILEMPQVADWNSPFASYLSDSKLWIVAPGTDKIVKLVLGGSTMSNTTGTFDAATMTQDTTFYKLWKASVVTSAVGGEIALS